MKMKITSLLTLILLLSFNSVFAQKKAATKFPEHPLTLFNFVLGGNFTAAAKGSIAPGFLAGAELEHQFKNSPLGFSLGIRVIRLSAKNEVLYSKFLINEYFTKLSYRISRRPIYVNAGYSYGRIFDSNTRLSGLIPNVYFGTFGVEHKFFIPEKLVLSIGANYKVTNIYDVEFGLLNTFEFLIKIGKK